jgi:hypothetical protein
MSPQAFKLAILKAHPSFAMSAVFHRENLDIIDRWHILTQYPVKLFYLKKGEFVDR